MVQSSLRSSKQSSRQVQRRQERNAHQATAERSPKEARTSVTPLEVRDGQDILCMS